LEKVSFGKECPGEASFLKKKKIVPGFKVSKDRIAIILNESADCSRLELLSIYRAESSGSFKSVIRKAYIFTKVVYNYNLRNVCRLYYVT
jgi:hypothetical protein